MGLTSLQVREAVIVFLGSLAKHMDKEDPKVLAVVDALVSALSTPSEAVQVSRSPLQRQPRRWAPPWRPAHRCDRANRR